MIIKPPEIWVDEKGVTHTSKPFHPSVRFIRADIATNKLVLHDEKLIPYEDYLDIIRLEEELVKRNKVIKKCVELLLNISWLNKDEGIRKELDDVYQVLRKETKEDIHL